MARPNRRQALKDLGLAGAGLAISGGVIRGQAAEIVIAGRPVEIAVSPVSAVAVRIIIRPIVDGVPAAVPVTGALERDSFGATLARARTANGLTRVRAGDLTVRFHAAGPALTVETAKGNVVQRFGLSAEAPGMSFLLPKGPLLGLDPLSRPR